MVGHQEANQFCQYFGPNENAQLKVQSQVQNTAIIDTSALIEEKSQSRLFFLKFSLGICMPAKMFLQSNNP